MYASPPLSPPPPSSPSSPSPSSWATHSLGSCESSSLHDRSRVTPHAQNVRPSTAHAQLSCTPSASTASPTVMPPGNCRVMYTPSRKNDSVYVLNRSSVSPNSKPLLPSSSRCDTRITCAPSPSSGSFHVAHSGVPSRMSTSDSFSRLITLPIASITSCSVAPGAHMMERVWP